MAAKQSEKKRWYVTVRRGRDIFTAVVEARRMIVTGRGDLVFTDKAREGYSGENDAHAAFKAGVWIAASDEEKTTS